MGQRRKQKKFERKWHNWAYGKIKRGAPRQDVSNQLLKKVTTSKRVSSAELAAMSAVMQEINAFLYQRNMDAVAAETAGRNDEAIALYVASVKDRFVGSLPYERLCVLYADREEYHFAIWACEAYLKIDRKSKKAQHFQEQVKRLKQKQQEQKSSPTAPTSKPAVDPHAAQVAVTRLDQAMKLAQAGHKEEARAILKDIIQQDRDNADAWVLMARVAEEKEQAVYCLEQILRIKPGNEWALNGLQKLAPEKAAALPKKLTEEPSGFDKLWAAFLALAPVTKVIIIAGILLGGCCGIGMIRAFLFPPAADEAPVETQAVVETEEPLVEVVDTLPTDISLPSDTPLPTDTPEPIPTSTPGPSPEVIDYNKDIHNRIDELVLGLENFSDLSFQASDNPALMLNDEWLEDMNFEMTWIKMVHQDVEQMDVPPEIADIHQVIQGGTSDCAQAMDVVAEGINKLDAALLQQGSDLITTCGEKVEEGLTLLDEYMENPVNTQPEASAATETPTSTSTPTKVPTNTPSPTEEENLYPDCPDMSCGDFDTCEDVREFLDYCPQWWGELDHNSNGVPCESLCG